MLARQPSADETLQKAYFEKVSELEEKLTSDIWNRKTFYWFKLNITPISYDLFSIVSKADTASHNSPIGKEVYNPSVEFSANFYRVSKRRITFYLSGWIKGSQKHTLSETGTTSTWNKISTLGDSSFIADDTKDVYFLSNATIAKKFMADYGAEIIMLFPETALRGFTPGINITYASLGSYRPRRAAAVARSVIFNRPDRAPQRQGWRKHHQHRAVL